MVDYSYRHGDAENSANAIEMGMAPSQRMPTNQSSTTFVSHNSHNSNDAYQKKEQAVDHDDLDEPETDYQPVNWKHVLFSKKYLPIWIILIIVGVLTALITIKHDQVVEALRPFAEKVRNIPAGWLIFVAVLVIISFPPLFGHELVALLAGVVYGLWIGFAVVAAGTFIGEIGTWFAFKRLFRRKAEKMERTNLTYGAMARLCREGGFWMVFVIRLSIVPSHISTAVFSTCDVRFWHFAISTFFTLPKQLILVYLGVLLVGGQSDFWIKFGLFGVAGAITVVSGAWIWWKMAAIKKELIVKQDALRARRALRRDNSYNNQQAGAASAYANQFEQEQAQAYDASYLGPAGSGTQQQEKTYTPFNAQSRQPASLPEVDTSGDLGMYGRHAYSSSPSYSSSPPGMAFSTPEAYHSPSPSAGAVPRFQASVQDSPEQPAVYKPHRFV